MRSRNLAIGLGLLLAVATSVPAFAQSASPAAQPYPASCSPSSVPQSESEKAHAMYQAGKVHYDDKSYDQAIQQFRDAYKRDCSKHDLLIIISRAYELKGDKPEALRALETFLERVPNSPDAASHRAGIENLKRQIAAQAAAAASASNAAASASAAPPPPEREHTIPPWVVVGLGGAAVITGGILLVLAPTKPSNCDTGNNKCTKTTDASGKQESDADLAHDQDQAGKAVGYSTAGLVFVLGGVGLIGGGLLWHFLEPTGPESPSSSGAKTKLTPQLAPGYAGASFGGTF